MIRPPEPVDSAYPLSPATEAAPREEGFPLLDYLQLLWFRRRLIAVITLLVALLAWIHVNQLESVYTARSSLLIGVQEPRPVDPNTFFYQQYFGMNAIEEMEVLQSRGLAEKVITRLNLLARPEFNPALRGTERDLGWYLGWLNPVRWIPDSWKDTVRQAVQGEVVEIEPSADEIERGTMVRAVDIFLNKLKVESVEYSDVLLVSFSSPDPRLAEEVANTLPEVYIVDKLEAKFEATERVTNWLSEQLADLEEKVQESEQAVEMYRAQYGLTQGARGDILSEQLSSINGQLIIARAERAEAEARLAQVERLLQSGGAGVETAGDVMASQAVQQLRAQEAEIMRRVSELAVEFGPRHPRMLQVNAELEDVRDRITEEIDKVVLALENEVEVARTREASLAQSLAEAERQTGAQNREAVQLRALEREAAANRTLFETFLNRFKETSTTQGTETPDARVLSRAELPSNPSWPNRGRVFTVITLLGFLAACGLVFGLHLMNPGLLSPEQVEQELGVHAIGLVPKLEGRIAPHDHVRKRPNSHFVEAIDSLKIALKLSDPDARIKAIQVTSSLPEEGKTSLVIALGMVLARAGSKVVILDGDLRRSTIEAKLGLKDAGPGLTDLVIAERDELEPYIIHEPVTGVDIMRTGEARYVSATDLFASQRMRHIVGLLRAAYDYVLIDSPPVLAVADARIIGNLADKTLFVVRWDKTPKKVARAALSELHKSGTRLAGVVLQQVDLKRYGRLGYGESGYYYHHGRYGAYYG